ncbi:MAG: ABC transporter permease subunit [Methylococcaceae bacterium]|nr:ABC transporter permease subunit [Methylococcaceae bacterium]MDD1608209.1 ABC transporter permease subunit [Methylococcaceae bacterium]MDD1609426.1 ABC transporter permease subunit [Methylococcaceae bacterium]MDD1615101.1 ABC transporter permease subunit [Methylococcaceae bacterium]OYV21160.1 MAG: sulfonate transport system permease protein [Methylococcaceae bacterium NSP1-2]
MNIKHLLPNYSKWLGRTSGWLLPIFLIIFWCVSVQNHWISSRILPSPLDIVDAAISLSLSGELVKNIAASAERAAYGLLIGGSIGFFLGLANGLFRTADRFLDTTVQMIRNVPHLALIPLVIIWFGIGEEGKVFLVTLGVFFPIYANTYHGIKTADPQLLEMGRVYGLNYWQLFSQIIFPGALPSILVGLRYSLGLMWLTLIVAETIATTSGIGYMAMNAREFMQTDVVVLAILIYALLGKFADTSVHFLEWRLLQWHPSFRRA